MARIAYLDCFAGASGDMLLGALVDAGLDAAALEADLRRLAVPGWRLAIERVSKLGLAGTRVMVHTEEQHHHRRLADIEAIIGGSGLPQPVQELALTAFRRLAAAEARVHGTTPELVHFHEVGAVDSIVDTVGCAIGLHRLRVQRLYASPLHVGRGLVRAAHGLLPVPAPATLELLKGAPVYAGEVEAELLTPTAAALISSAVAGYGPLPLMAVEAIGYGAGNRDLSIPNLLRLVLGEAAGPSKPALEEAPGAGAGGFATDEVMVLEANVDDMAAELWEHVMAALQGAGAVDVFLQAVQMKKNRPGTLVTVLAPPERAELLAGVLFAETTTLGVRRYLAQRYKLGREVWQVQTPYGLIRVKVGLHQGRVLNLAPEYGDCRAAAQARRVPLKEIYQAVTAAAWQMKNCE